MVNQPTAILVLGMHRSGTSALTRVLNLMGLDLPSGLMGPVENNNETGFWESQEIADIHDELLEEIGSSWDDCLRIPPQDLGSTPVREHAEKILGILERDFASSTGFVIKDPRLCRLVPLWKPILEDFGARTHLILIERHPLEVAASLEARDHFTLGKSLHLWLRHVLDMERNSRSLSRSLVTYPQLLDDWRGTLDAIAADLGISWPRDPEDAASEIEGFLSTNLRHHQVAMMSSAGQPVLYDWASQAHEAFVAATIETTALADSLDPIAADLEHAEAIFAPAVAGIQKALRASNEEARSLRSERDRSVDSKIGKILAVHEEDKKRYEAEIASLADNLASDRDSFNAEIQQLAASHQKDRDSYEAEIAKNRGLLEDFDAKIYEMRDSLEEQVEERDRLLDLVSSTQSTYEAELTAVQSALEEAESQIRERQRTLDALSEQKEQWILQRQELEDRNGRLIREHNELEEERNRLVADLEHGRSQIDRLEADLDAGRSRFIELEQSRHIDEQHRVELQTQLAELEETLASTARDKDWLWDQWHQTKDELAAPLKSRFGRLVWAQWQVYLKARASLVRLKNSLVHAHAAPQSGSPATTSSLRALLRLPLLVGRWAVRWVTRGLGWIYLFFAVTFELAFGSLRGLMRGSKVDDPLPSSPTTRGRKPRVLLVSPYPIFPANHGGGVRLYNLVQRLSEHSELHLLIFSVEGEDPAQREALEPWAASVHFHHWQPRYEPGYWRLEPPNAQLFASDDAARQIAHLLASKNIDILQLEYTELGHFGLPQFAGVKVVLTEHDLAYRQHWRRRKMGFHHRFPEGNAYGSSFGDWLRLTRYELAVCRRADQVHVMSRDDGESLSRFLPDTWDRLRIVPNAVDTTFYVPDPMPESRQDVLYVGNFQNLPNIDALEYLVAEIWPQVREEIPVARLTVVGANPSERVTRFDQQDGIEVVGAVPDLRPYYHGHRLMVAPIRAGSGTRLKILEAFAAGLPVVSTTLGAEGIAARSNEHLLRADDTSGFAKSIVRLLQDEDLCAGLSANALALVRESYDWQRSAEATLEGWDELIDVDTQSGSTGSPPKEDSVQARREPVSQTSIQSKAVDISVVIPTFHGGEDLERCLKAISNQRCERSVEIVCVDSGSPECDLDLMHRLGVNVVSIDPVEFDHGLTRDLGAANCRGEVLVFLNQDAIPEGTDWLTKLTQPLFDDPECAAVQGGMREVDDTEDRFFWDSCGERFYFTRESDRWLERYYGIGFSTVNAAIRRGVWQEIPFGRAPIMEDKKWQKEVVDRRHIITTEPDAVVVHTHNYGLRSLWRRCQSEGFGWRLVGESYSLLDMIRDGMQLRVHKDLLRGLTSGRIRSSAELLFPWLRPFALYWGNHWSRGVKL